MSEPTVRRTAFVQRHLLGDVVEAPADPPAKKVTKHARGPRKLEGYTGNRHTIRERAWYLALAETVGYKDAPLYADDIINWHQGRPPDHILKRWLYEYDDGNHQYDDAVKTRVEQRVARLNKQRHMGFLQRMIKAGHRALDPVEEDGDMKQPVILKYIADGVNQGMLLHNQKQQQESSISLGGLTINVGKQPPPRKLRAKDVDAVVDGEFKLLPAGEP